MSDGDKADEQTTVSSRVPAHLVSAIDAMFDNKSELIRETFQAAADTGSYGPDDRLRVTYQRLVAETEEAERHVEKLTSDLRRAERTAEQKRKRRDQVREKMENVATAEERLEAALGPLEADLRDGRRIFANLGTVQATARTHGVEAEEIIEMLRERNPDVPTDAFEAPGGLGQPDGMRWGGVPLQDRDLPVEERPEAP